jgi:hypothetical protein
LKKFFNNSNEKITEKTFFQGLLISAFGFLVCAVMLCSVTYAWFLDSTVTKNNIITSGKFGIEAAVTDAESATVAVTALSDGSYTCVLANKNTAYTVVLSLTAETTVKGFCKIALNEEEFKLTESMSKDAAIGVASLTFTITPVQDNTVVSIIPQWGYPAAPTIQNGTSI